MKNLFTKERPVRNIFIALLVLAILIVLVWEIMEPTKPRPQPVVETKIPVSPKPVIAAVPPPQEAARAVPPCPEKKKTPLKKKKIQRPKSAPPVTTSRTLMASETKGCVEIHLPPVRRGDIGVKGLIAGRDRNKILHSDCTGFKAQGDTFFSPLPDEICPKTLPIVCDFARQEEVIGQSVQIKFSFFTKPGIAYVLRLPSFMATDESETVAVGLVQNLLSREPGSTAAYRETVQYAKTNNAMMGIPSSCYEGGVATVYYTQGDIPATAGCRLYLFVPRTDWKGP